MTAEHIEVGWATDVGGRSENQDRCAVSPRWAVVCDGLGGLAGGARAAQLAVDAVVSCLASRREMLDGTAVEQAVNDANEAVLAGRAADESVAGMCATLTLAVATAVSREESTWLVGNVGDSPGWVVTAAGPRRVTEDQNVAADLVRAGSITADAARQHPGRHVVTQAIGVARQVHPLMHPALLRPGEALVVASDGLSDLPSDVTGILAGSVSSEEAAARLVRFALDDGATDNVTAAVVRHLA